MKVKLANLEITDHKVKGIKLKKPLRISVCRETGQLLIGQWENIEFVVRNVQSDVLKHMHVSNTDGSGQGAWCVTATGGRYAVLVWDKYLNGRIQWLDEEGHCTDTYGHDEGEKMKKAFQVIDVPGTEGSLIVVDSVNDRLHLVDSEHRLAQYLLTKEDNILGPKYLYLDEATSRLYVSHGAVGAYEVRVYIWQRHSGDSEIINFEVDVSLGKLSK